MSDEWAVLCVGRSAREALTRWSAAEPSFTEFGSVADVLAACHRRGDPKRSAWVLRGLLRQAADPLAARVLLQALTPGLVQIVSRVRRQPVWLGATGVWPTLSDVSADVVAAAVGTITSFTGREVEWPQTVLLDGVWHRMEAMVRRWRRWGCGQTNLPLAVAEPEVHPALELAGLIADAVGRGRVSRSDAELVWRYRFDDEPATVVALERGCSAPALRARRERAERALACPARAG